MGWKRPMIIASRKRVPALVKAKWVEGKPATITVFC
jgi:hypothetical protein